MQNGLKLMSSNHFSVYTIILMSFRPSAPPFPELIVFGRRASETFSDAFIANRNVSNAYDNANRPRNIILRVRLP